MQVKQVYCNNCINKCSGWSFLFLHDGKLLKTWHWSNLTWESYLPDWHPADRRIQDSGVGIGAHFRHKTKPLPPANTVLLNLLPVGRKKQQREQINLWDEQFGILHSCASNELFISKCLSISAYSSLLWGNKTDNDIETYEVKWQQHTVYCVFILRPEVSNNYSLNLSWHLGKTQMFPDGNLYSCFAIFSEYDSEQDIFSSYVIHFSQPHDQCIYWGSDLSEHVVSKFFQN